MSVDECMRRLRSAESFVDLGRALSELEDPGSHARIIELSARNGPPVIAIDNIAATSALPADRLAYMTHGYANDPLRAAVHAARCPAGSEIIEPTAWDAIARHHNWRGPMLHPLYLPLMDDTGVIGTLRFGFLSPVEPTLRDDLTRMAMHMSIKLAKLGIGAAEDGAMLATLTLRQRQVARLATLDRTNREIADELGLSVDTVKKHLKDAFARLSITSRRDLRALFRRLTPVTDVPNGVTVIDGMHVTRLDLADRAPKP